MKASKSVYLLALVSIFLLSGCVVRTYPLVKDRVDQDLTAGNRGYISGQAPAGETRERKATRTTQVVEVELALPSWLKKDKAKPVAPVAPVAQVAQVEDVMEAPRGWISEAIAPRVVKKPAPVMVETLERYKVRKGDTLQKISQKFYGTTRRWKKIYDVNRKVLKGPNKIYPGQIINVPVETLREPQENLK